MPIRRPSCPYASLTSPSLHHPSSFAGLRSYRRASSSFALTAWTLPSPPEHTCLLPHPPRSKPWIAPSLVCSHAPAPSGLPSDCLLVLFNGCAFRDDLPSKRCLAAQPSQVSLSPPDAVERFRVPCLVAARHRRITGARCHRRSLGPSGSRCARAFASSRGPVEIRRALLLGGECSEDTVELALNLCQPIEDCPVARITSVVVVVRLALGRRLASRWDCGQGKRASAEALRRRKAEVWIGRTWPELDALDHKDARLALARHFRCRGWEERVEF
jgi:hypothetical protein